MSTAALCSKLKNHARIALAFYLDFDIFLVENEYFRLPRRNHIRACVNCSAILSDAGLLTVGKPKPVKNHGSKALKKGKEVKLS